jgi:internalin A
MKLKKTVVWLWCAVLCVLLAACGQAGKPRELTPTAGGNCAPEQVVNIPNSIVRQAVLGQLNQDASLPICQEDMLRVTDLVIVDNGRLNIVTDLEGLQYATNLKTLETRLYWASLRDLTPLTNLLKLEQLSLDVDYFENNIRPLSGLINLKRLVLRSGNVGDISPLSGLVNLEYLDLSVNYIPDASPLSGLVNLEYLDLAYNRRISDISWATNLTNLKYLNLWGNAISDASPLSGLVNLEYLDLSFNDIPDASPLSGLVNLEYLDLAYNQISSISWATDLTNLKHLDLGLNQLEPIQGESNLNLLVDMTKLEYLSLSGTTWVEDITPLANLSQLKTLYLDRNQISDIAPLANLTQLTGLFLGENNIHNLTPLANLSQLNTLSLRNNHISNLEPLKYLANVKTLDLANNRVSNVEVLAHACAASFDVYYDGPPFIDLRVVDLTNNRLDLNNAWTRRDLYTMQYCGMVTEGVPYIEPEYEPNPYSE